MTQALLNLVVQASAASTSCPIEMTVAARKDVVRVAVVDAGPPLQEPVPEQGFAATVRVLDADRGCHRGTSLGLALAQATIEAHGGQTEAANRDGGG